MSDLIVGARRAVIIAVVCWVLLCVVYVVSDLVSWIGYIRATRESGDELRNV